MFCMFIIITRVLLYIMKFSIRLSVPVLEEGGG